MSGFTDLHCHLLYGVDDGAKTLEDSLEMGRALVDLGFSTVAPSPHARPQYAPREVALQRLEEVQAAFDTHGVPLRLHPNAENYLLDEQFLATLGSAASRRLGAGAYALVELPYASPVPALGQLLFQMTSQGVVPLIAHPERCLEFSRKGQAAEAVRLGARLQLDVGALMGRYGPQATRVAGELLEQGLYAVAATDLHGPTGARDWLGRAFRALEERAGPGGMRALLQTNPGKILAGDPLES